MDFSFQLYSARNFGPWSEVLSMLASVGYAQVEGFGGVYDDPAGFRAVLDQNKLIMPSGHFSIEDLENDVDRVIETASILGIERIFCPFLDEDQRPIDKAGWQNVAARLSKISRKIKDAGFGFGWHNHDFEFVPLADGSIPMHILLDTASEIDWEADIAWVLRGGSDPFEWIARYSPRITAVHVKDIAPQGQSLDEDGWCDVGQGTLDWTKLFKELRGKTPAKLFIMEHDNPADANGFAKRSIEWANGAAEPAL